MKHKADCRQCKRAGPEELRTDVPGSGGKCWCPTRNRFVAVRTHLCESYIEVNNKKKNEQQKK